MSMHDAITLIDTRISIKHVKDLRDQCDKALTLTRQLFAHGRISQDEMSTLMSALATTSAYMSFDLRRAGVEV